METHKPSPRKPDLLDEINALRKQRGIAYCAGDLITLEQAHQEMKAFWMKNGWTAVEAHEEYLIHVKHCETPYKDTIDELNAIRKHLLLLAHN